MSAAADETAASALEDAVGLAFRVLQVVMVLLVVAFIGSGMFTVAPHEVAFVVRLGTLDREPKGPGAHLAWPVIDQVVRVDVGRATRHGTDAFDLMRSSQELTTGKVERKGGVDPAREGYLVTGDANLVHAGLAVRVVVRDAVDSLLAFQDGGAAVQVLLERAAVHAAAGRSVDALLGAGKGDFTNHLRDQLQEALDGLGAGLTVQGIDLERDLTPPPQVRASFEAVQAAAQDRDRLRSEALAAASRARGEGVARAARVRAEARTAANRLRADAEADASVFAAQLEEHRRDPAGHAERRLAATLARAVADVEELFRVRRGPLRVRLERDVKARQDEVLEQTKREEGIR